VAHEGANLLQNTVLITGPEPVIIATELNQSRPRYGAGQMTTSLDAHRPVAAAVEDECRRGDEGQQWPDVSVAQRLQHCLDRTGARSGAQQAGPPVFRLAIADEAL
jgi:hypothetical protein